MSGPSAPPPATGRRRARVSLQLKVVLALTLIVLAPLLASSYLIDQLARVAANFAANEAQAREAPMARALDAYRELFETTKRLHAEIGGRLAADPAVSGATTPAALEVVLAREPALHLLAVIDPVGVVTVSARRPLPAAGWALREVEHPLPSGLLRLGFAVPADLQTDYQVLGQALDHSRSVATVRSALPAGYRWAFLALLAGAAVLTVLLGLLAARVVTRRIAALVTTARQVSAGQQHARALLRGADEMAELAGAFNTMLDDLDGQRRQIEYLQRIGAWQDVARRLAHEIKNPLTPIQLAVQQCVSAYRGDDAKFRRLLTDAGEIVEEEIAGLRRLVDTFRTLGQLPKVEAAPLAIAEVLEELLLDPALAPRVTLRAPDRALTVRGDKLLLKRVMVNLVENGVQAGQEAGRAGDVVVGWTPDQRGRVTITIDDQGKGVASADRDKIFEPYVTTKATGTGLGLAIAKKLVLEHGGDLEVAPTPAPTGGARFVVVLPGEP
jgi:two-component system nitrogen regulation sensor histidine kinase NtrY